MGNTSIGRGPAHGSNENHDGDPTHKTMGEAAAQDDPATGTERLDEAAPQAPAGVKGARPNGGIARGPQSHPDGPDVENSPWAPEAARGRQPKQDK